MSGPNKLPASDAFWVCYILQDGVSTMRSYVSVAVATGLMVLLIPVLAMSTITQPPRGTAVVDGQYAEWNLTRDFFTGMYRAGDTGKTLESKCFLRYDCLTNTMYVLVLVEPGAIGCIEPQDATSWVAVDDNSAKAVNEHANQDGIPPDFAWIGRAYDDNPLHVRGYEASFIMLPGAYMLLVHMNVWDEEMQTSATIGSPKVGIPIEIPSLPSAAEPTTLGRIKALYR
jgi:hypothetical protein